MIFSQICWHLCSIERRRRDQRYPTSSRLWIEERFIQQPQQLCAKKRFRLSFCVGFRLSFYQGLVQNKQNYKKKQKNSTEQHIAVYRETHITQSTGKNRIWFFMMWCDVFCAVPVPCFSALFALWCDELCCTVLRCMILCFFLCCSVLLLSWCVFFLLFYHHNTSQHSASHHNNTKKHTEQRNKKNTHITSHHTPQHTPQHKKHTTITKLYLPHTHTHTHKRSQILQFFLPNQNSKSYETVGQNLYRISLYE